MGKRIISQRRGRGGSTYRAPSHNYKGKIKYRHSDKTEKESVVYGVITDLISCPGHTAPLARVKYDTNETVLLAAPRHIKVGDVVASGASAPVQTGNVLPLRVVPEGSLVFNLELKPGDGGKLVRTAGSFAKVIGKVGDKVLVRLPSKKQKSFVGECRATIGAIAGDGRFEKPVLKAGKKMHMSRAKNKLYPKTSGVAMNAVDHPFGSGRGRNPGKPKTAPKYAPAGRNVGLIKARKTGRGKGRKK
jgi:large subunit ribosomal protein L2